MTKAGTRRFFVVGTLICAVLFIALTIDTHRTVLQIPREDGEHAPRRGGSL